MEIWVFNFDSRIKLNCNWKLFTYLLLSIRLESRATCMLASPHMTHGRQSGIFSKRGITEAQKNATGPGNRKKSQKNSHSSSRDRHNNAFHDDANYVWLQSSHYMLSRLQWHPWDTGKVSLYPNVTVSRCISLLNQSFGTWEKCHSNQLSL